MRERVVSRERKSLGRALIQANQEGVIVGFPGARTEENALSKVVVKCRQACEQSLLVDSLKDTAHVPEDEVSTCGSGERNGAAGRKVFKPGLRCDRRSSSPCAKLCGDSVERLSESLSRTRILKINGGLTKAHTLRQVITQATGIGHFKEHVAGELALHAQVNGIIAPDFDVRIILEGKYLRKADSSVQGIKCHLRHDRIRLGRNHRDRHGAVLANSEDAEGRIHTPGIAASSARASQIARGGCEVQGLRETNAESRDDHTLHRVLAIIDDAKPGADHRLARTKE